MLVWSIFFVGEENSVVGLPSLQVAYKGEELWRTVLFIVGYRVLRWDGQISSTTNNHDSLPSAPSSKRRLNVTHTWHPTSMCIHQGIFFRSAAGSVAATQWDASAEDLVDAHTCLPDGAVQALRESVLRLEMDKSLG